VSARYDLTGGDVLELTGAERDRPPGLVRRLAPWGGVRWSAAGGEDDPFVDLRLAGEEVLATSARGQVHRIGLDDGRVRSVGRVE